MRGKLTWGVVGLVLLGACGGDKSSKVDTVVRVDTVRIPPADEYKKQETIKVSADCVNAKEVYAEVDKWVVKMQKKGEVTFVITPTNGAVIEIVQKTAEKWPFDESSPSVTTSKKGKIKDKPGEYRYNVQITCGTAPNDRKVTIDPDIFVN